MFVWAVQLYRILRFLRVLHWISSWIRGNKIIIIVDFKNAKQSNFIPM